jgi:hypothetical protein
MRGLAGWAVDHGDELLAAQESQERDTPVD